MALETLISSHEYFPGSAMAPEPIPFPFLANSEILAKHINGAGVETPLAEGIDYVLSGQGTAGLGTIRALAAYPDDHRILIERSTEPKQKAVIKPQEPFPAAAAEQQLDRITMLLQELRRDLDGVMDRGWVVPRYENVVGKFSVVLPGGVPGFASGTGADPALRIDLAQAAGAGLAGFSHAASYTAASVGGNLQKAIPTVNSIDELRANDATGFRRSVHVRGYYAPADLGGGQFDYDASDTTSADDGGTIIVDAAGRRWKRWLPDRVLTPQMFGCKCDNATDDRVRLQAMFNAANRPEGNLIRLIAGQCLVSDSVNIDYPVAIVGEGPQMQPAGTPYAGFVFTHPTHNFLVVRHSKANLFADFGIRAGVTRTAGCDILVQGDGENQPIGTVFRSLVCNGGFTALSIPNMRHLSVTNCGFYNIGHNGGGNAIYYPSNVNPDSGDNYIVGNTFQSSEVAGVHGHGYSAIYLESTFALCITANKFFGFEYGIECNVKNTSGNLLVNGNSFEQQTSCHIDIRQGAAGAGIGNIVIVGNEFSQLDSVANPVNPSLPTINVQAGMSGAYVNNLLISSNVFNDSYTTTASIVALADGPGALIEGNVFNLYGKSQPGALQTFGYAAACRLLDNVFRNMATSQHYKNGLLATTIVRDDNLTFADVGGWGNGSQIYVSNGTSGTPLTGGGTGAIAFRVNGVWKAI